MLTSKKSFKEWGEIFGDTVEASTLPDRLLHRCYILNIKDNSYRLRQYPGLDLSENPPPPRRRGWRPKAQEASA